MRLFSIQQVPLLLRFTIGGETHSQLLDFGQHPEDSSIVRLRVTPPLDGKKPLPDGAAALELEFDRNGRVRSERQWPMKYPAWDQRTPEEIEKAFATQAKALEEDQAEHAADDPGEQELPAVPASKFKRK